MTVVGIALLAALALGIAHLTLITKCTAWHHENVRTIRRHDLTEYQRRLDNPPWYTRYLHWHERRKG